MLQNFHDVLLSNNNILFFDEYFSKITFFANKMGILSVDLDKINLDDDNNFDGMILTLSFMSDCWLGVMNFKNAKHLKKI